MDSLDEERMSMRRDVAVLGDESMTMGFRLAGVSEYRVVDEADQKKFDSELSKMMDNGGFGVIIASREQLDAVSPELSTRMMGQMLPIVVGVPCKGVCRTTLDPIHRMLKRTLGIEVRSEG